VRAESEDGCWIWQGWIDRYGYGRDNTARKYAHRLVYESIVGPIPDGMVMDHLCHNADLSCAGGSECRHRACVNPAHLEPVSRSENAKRGRGAGVAHASKTECKQGHPYDEANTYHRPNGGRGCRKCKAEAMERFYARKSS
jgi:hypothetical protein